ncbi:MAG: GTP-binding protein LepA [Leptotrichia hongkongensis]
MTYKVLKSLVYGGIAYAEGQEVDILEKSVVKSCIERELIEEIKDTTEKVVSENLIEENNQDTEKTDKENKKNKNK